MMHGRGFFNGNMLWGGGILGSVWFWLIVVGVIIAVTAIIYLAVRNHKSYKPADSALETLNTRFAKGEITEEEYNKRKEIIKR